MSSDNCRYWKEGVESEGEGLDEAQKWQGCHMFEAFYLHGKHSIGSFLARLAGRRARDVI